MPCTTAGWQDAKGRAHLDAGLDELGRMTSLMAEGELLFVGLRVRMSITTGKAELASLNVVGWLLAAALIRQQETAASASLFHIVEPLLS